MPSIKSKRSALLLVVTAASVALATSSQARPLQHSHREARTAQAACNPRRPWVPQDSIAIGQHINRTANQVNAGLDQVKRLSTPTHPVYPGSQAAAETFAATEGISQTQAQTTLTEYLQTLCTA